MIEKKINRGDKLKTSELFEKEISFIKNEHMRKIVAITLDESPECIQTIPASSSGRYHPQYSLGDGGLARHIKATVGIAYSMIDSDVLKGLLETEKDEFNSNLYADVVYAALILHDCCKPDDTPKHSTRFDHPLVGAELFKKVVTEYMTYAHDISDSDFSYLKRAIPLVSKCIKSHMGIYTTAPYARGIVLPKPSGNLEWFVHSCDLLSSRKYLEFDFDKYYSSLK